MTTKPLKWQRQEILIEASLYQEFDLKEIEDKDFAKFVLGGGALDAYCVVCEQASVFQLEETKYNYDEKAKNIPKFGVITLQAECTRHAENY